MTWPLAAGLGRDVPGDLGDSVLNMWILSWGAEHVPQLLTGGITWTQFWDANIFHPAPLGLALSEHLFGQVLQILPVYWLTGNIILCYNLLFISTFVLSGFGTYLLVYDLTGDRRAAFVAGLVYGFLPYRIASVPHVQVMSSQWMPFALWGLNRFITTHSYKALAGGTAALVMQNWSCGYFLLYFAPFAPLFLVHRMWALGTLRSVRTWAGLIAAAAVTLVLTLPFLIPYTQAQQRFGFERPFGEVVQFSANVWSYVTASESLSLFGKALRYYPHGEGETFLGFVPWLLALVALLTLIAATGSDPGQEAPGSLTPPLPLWKRLLIALLATAVVTQFIAVVSAVVFGGFNVDVLGLAVRARTPQRLIWQFLAVAALLLAVSPRTRATAMRVARSPLSFVAVATVLAMWLSLGPLPKAGDTLVSGFGLYGVLYEYVPGFNGVRVPARYAMIAGLFLAVMAGYGVSAIVRRAGAFVPATLAVIALLILVEGAAVPLPINGTWGQNEATPPARVVPTRALAHRSLGEGVPPVYAAVAALPAGSAITEFPFGDAAWEIRYVYYSAAHWKPITNGYSGSFPPDYSARVARLKDVTVNPEASWRSLRDSGSTHVVVHPGAFANPAHATSVQTWLEAHGATLVETFADRDALYAIR